MLRYAGGPRLTDADPRADALVAALIAHARGTGRPEVVAPDIRALTERYVDLLRDAGYEPECVVIGIKDALRRAHRDGPLAHQEIAGAFERRDFALVSLGIRRLYVTRETPARYADRRGEQIVATAMLQAAGAIEEAVAGVEQACVARMNSREFGTELPRSHPSWHELERCVREIARAFKALAMDEDDAINRVRAMMNVSVHRHVDLPEHELLTSSTAAWAHDAYASA